VEVEARDAAGLDGEPTMAQLNELSHWQDYFAAEARSQDWDATYGQSSQQQLASRSAAEAASSAAAVANQLASVVEGGWMRGSLSWEGALMLEDAVQLKVVPAAACSAADKARFATVPSNVAAQLASELQGLWERELSAWLSAQLNGAVSARFGAEVDHCRGAPESSVVILWLELQSLSPQLSLANEIVTSAVGKLLAAVLKGQASSDPRHDLHGLPLLALSCQASQPVAAALARHVAVPRMLNRAAQLRAVSAQLQHSLEDLPEVTTLVAEPQATLHNLFTVPELQELLEYERLAQVASSSRGRGSGLA